jgi:hypothetical protein
MYKVGEQIDFKRNNDLLTDGVILEIRRKTNEYRVTYKVNNEQRGNVKRISWVVFF